MGGEGVDELVLSHDRVHRRSLDAIGSWIVLVLSVCVFLALHRQTGDESDGAVRMRIEKK